MSVKIIVGDCRDVLKTLPDASVDSIVTDPPYELTSGKKGGTGAASVNLDSPYGRARIGTGNGAGGFMGKKWDATGIAHDPAMWAECLRVLKPGGYLLAFAGTRTYHRMTCAIEDAGFEIRDQIGWAFGSGFPKSLDVSKAIDAQLGAARELTRAGEVKRDGYGGDWDTGSSSSRPRRDEPATEEARQWQGWGTALKPAFEPVVVAQKPNTAQAILATLVPTIAELLCKVDSLARTDTSSSELLQALGFWSTASSLNECLVGLSQTASRFTTETAFAMTTDLRTLKFSLSRLTRAITTGDTSQTSGVASSASDAAAFSRSVQAKCARLSATTAGAIAIDWSADEGSAPEESRLSPNWQSIVLARKPLKGTVAANVLAHGTGALNIDGARVAVDPRDPNARATPSVAKPGMFGVTGHSGTLQEGRWPANLIHDGSDEVLAAFPQAPGQLADVSDTAPSAKTGRVYGPMARTGEPSADSENTGSVGFKMKPGARRLDNGSAARFFYCAKASRTDRDEGLDGMPTAAVGSLNMRADAHAERTGALPAPRANTHPTVKPTDLMRYLCRLVTPPGGIVLDPFMGSGSTLKAAELEGFDAIGIELSEEYAEIARRRIGADSPLFAEVTS